MGTQELSLNPTERVHLADILPSVNATALFPLFKLVNSDLSQGVETALFQKVSDW